MKRFSETSKWEDPWFRKLKPKYKTFLQYLFDRCDNAGVWVVDMDLAATYVGERIDPQEALRVFSGRVVEMARGKWLIPQFVSFQYGKLSPTCHPHKRIIEAMNRHSLRVAEDGKTTHNQRLGGGNDMKPNYLQLLARQDFGELIHARYDAPPCLHGITVITPFSTVHDDFVSVFVSEDYSGRFKVSDGCWISQFPDFYSCDEALSKSADFVAGFYKMQKDDDGLWFKYAENESLVTGAIFDVAQFVQLAVNHLAATDEMFRRKTEYLQESLKTEQSRQIVAYGCQKCFEQARISGQTPESCLHEQ